MPDIKDPLLEMRGIVKQFPGVRALDGVDLRGQAGEVHCLLGQNGAGKSTLIKVLAGAHQPDAGEIRWTASRSGSPSPVAAITHGIATIYQELDLVDGLTRGGEHLPRPRARRRSASPARAEATAAATPELLDPARPRARSARPPRSARCPRRGKQVVSAWPGRCPTTPG